MGLTTFEGDRPHLKDVVVAKNYLDEKELRAMGHLPQDAERILEVFAAAYQKMRIENWNFMRKCFVTILFVAASLFVAGQSEQQATLLRKALHEQSTELLFEFFNNWADEVKSNENEAANPYVAEAHKVFAAVYQPLHPEKLGFPGWSETYRDVPYFIVQGSLGDISQSEKIPKKGFPYEITLRTITKLDSAVEFRPPVSFENKKIVYLTTGYQKLLDSYLREKRADFGSFSKEQPDTLQDFDEWFNTVWEREVLYTDMMVSSLKKAALIDNPHFDSGWQYETYPKVESIVFDKRMRRAVVKFGFGNIGGEALLKKQRGKWFIVTGQFTWIS